MKKLVTPRKNDYTVTGIIVKEDAYINPSATMARFRIACASTGRDSQSVFLDCVMFAGKQGNLPVNILKKGTKVEINGYLHMNQPPEPAAGQERRPARLELVCNSVKENLPIEIEVADEADAQRIPEGNLAIETEHSINLDADLGDLPEDF